MQRSTDLTTCVTIPTSRNDTATVYRRNSRRPFPRDAGTRNTAVRGDTAMVSLTGGKRRVRLHQKDGSWLFPMEHMVPPFVDRANDPVVAVNQMTGVIRDAREKVDKHGKDAKTIQQEMRIGLWQLVDEWKKQGKAKRFFPIMHILPG